MRNQRLSTILATRISKLLQQSLYFNQIIQILKLNGHTCILEQVDIQKNNFFFFSKTQLSWYILLNYILCDLSILFLGFFKVCLFILDLTQNYFYLSAIHLKYSLVITKIIKQKLTSLPLINLSFNPQQQHTLCPSKYHYIYH